MKKLKNRRIYEGKAYSMPERKATCDDEKKHVGYHVVLPKEMSVGFKQMGISDVDFAHQGNKDLKDKYGYDIVLSLVSLKSPRSSKYIKRLSAHFYDDTRVDAVDIEKALATLECAKSSRKSVLIHCRGGVNRVSAVVAAWSMRHGGLSKEEALKLLEAAKRQEAQDWATFEGDSGNVMKKLLDNFTSDKEAPL